jgi:hypothetical protein
MQLRGIGSMLVGLTLAAAPSAFAATVTYATINANPATLVSTGAIVTGSIGSVGFTYSGELAFDNASGVGNTNYFTPLSTYTSTTVSNAPTNGGLIAISGDGTTDTFTFSTPVTGLILSEVSLGQSGVPTAYTFNDTFTVLSCGPGTIYQGGCFNQAIGSTGNSVLSADEGDGTIEFAGTISSLSFSTANGEYWNGFDLGLLPQTASPTPEPDTLVLAGTGLVGLLSAVRRRLAA